MAAALLLADGSSEAQGFDGGDNWPSSLASYGQALRSFEWNGRASVGTSFHVNVLNNNLEEVIRQLDAGEDVNATFGYETVWRGQQQFCTGKAIHLAASRGFESMVAVLLERRASLLSMVTRDGQNNYEVIHAAVFKEGRGGSSEMIDFLCSKGADIESLNANQWSCLHVAFQTGNRNTICAVQRALAQKRGPESIDDTAEEDSSAVTPLELGIKEGKMNTKDLAEVAPGNIRSLRSFTSRAPECVPMFLDRLSEDDLLRMAGQITHMDLARLVSRYPESAKKLLDKATVKARAADAEWHPLPQRVSFGRRWACMQSLFSSDMDSHYAVDGVAGIYLYETDNHWAFDGRLLHSPPWHSKIAYKDSGFDASIRVCHVPNIISPNVFTALVSSARRGDSSLCLYESSALCATVSYAFENGAMWFELLQCLIAVWGLALLVLQTCFNHEQEVGQGAEALYHRMDEGVFDPSLARSHRDGVVADWMIAKGFIDLFLEVAEVWGRVRIGAVRGHFTFGNLWDLLRSVTPVALLAFHSRRLLHLLVVLIYWMRLLESVILSEWIGCALLPLQKLLIGLMPALAFTVVCFGALTHAMYTVQVTAAHLWPKTVFLTFTRLIAQGLPEHAPEDGLELLVLYGGVVFFSIFVLNIFIGVIDEEYKNEKELSHLKFMGLRASSCLTYLLRIRVLPCKLLSSTAAVHTVVVGILAALGLQAAALAGLRLPGPFQLLGFVVCQLLMFLCPFQCRGDDGPWTDHFGTSGQVGRGAHGYFALGSGEPVKRYIWIVEPRDQRDRDLQGQTQPLKPGAPGSQEFSQLLSAVREATAELRGAKDLLEGVALTRKSSAAGDSVFSEPPGPNLLTSTPHPRDAKVSSGSGRA